MVKIRLKIGRKAHISIVFIGFTLLAAAVYAGYLTFGLQQVGALEEHTIKFGTEAVEQAFAYKLVSAPCISVKDTKDGVEKFVLNATNLTNYNNMALDCVAFGADQKVDYFMKIKRAGKDWEWKIYSLADETKFKGARRFRVDVRDGADVSAADVEIKIKLPDFEYPK